jgi:predicted enzyme related to lactoylglutathione lyase
MPDVAGDRASRGTIVASHTRPGRRHSKTLIPALLVAGLAFMPGTPCREDGEDPASQRTTATGDEAMTEDARDQRIDYIELPAVDIDAMKSFYGGVFGWTFVDYGPDYSSFGDGRMNGGFRKEPQVEAGGPLVVLFATDLEAAEARVRERGGRIVKDIFDFPGGRRFHFTDPSGNELAVWSDR